ncbi:MAG: HaeIII family restriction endonuclease [Spirochaetaceae bacterium]|nr:HaeIII family restriction endonuclease [Spirochaetaceae bacterium]
MEVLVWALSLSIHNASGWVEPSLKFDIQLIGVPNNLSSQIKSMVKKINESGCDYRFFLVERW